MKILNYIEEIISAVCLAVMTTIAFINVIARYIFGASLSFTDEITTYLFVLLTLMGASMAARRGAHLGLTVLTDIVSPAAKKVMAIIGYVFACAFSAILFYYGVLMVLSQIEKKQVTAGMQWPEWIFGSFVPIGAAFILIRFVQALINTIKIKNDKRKEGIS